MDKSDNGDGVEQRFIMIDQLAGQGIAPKDIATLKTAGFHTIEAIARSKQGRIEETCGFSESEADHIMRAVYSMLDFPTALELFNVSRNSVRITTGSKNLDALLGGGIETGSITEFYGRSGSGKTQLVHQLAVTCQLPIDMGGVEGKCLFIDSENTYRTERLVSIGKRYNCVEQRVLLNVLRVSAFNIDSPTRLLDDAFRLMSESRYGLLVVDSIRQLCPTLFFKGDEFATRQRKLVRFLQVFQRLAHKFGVAVVITNWDMASPEFAGEVDIPHDSITRVNLRQDKGINRIAKVFNSPYLPDGEASYSIKPSGIHDGVDDNSNELEMDF